MLVIITTFFRHIATENKWMELSARMITNIFHATTTHKAIQTETITMKLKIMMIITGMKSHLFSSVGMTVP
jgi:hypothetical protein